MRYTIGWKHGRLAKGGKQQRLLRAQSEASAGERILLGLENREKFYAELLVLEAAFSSGGAPIGQIQRALAILRDKVAGS